MKLLHLYIEKYKKYEKQHIVFSKDTSSCYQNGDRFKFCVNVKN